jgi:hypothetical protein
MSALDTPVKGSHRWLERHQISGRTRSHVGFPGGPRRGNAEWIKGKTTRLGLQTPWGLHSLRGTVYRIAGEKHHDKHRHGQGCMWPFSKCLSPSLLKHTMFHSTSQILNISWDTSAPTRLVETSRLPHDRFPVRSVAYIIRLSLETRNTRSIIASVGARQIPLTPPFQERGTLDRYCAKSVAVPRLGGWAGEQENVGPGWVRNNSPFLKAYKRRPFVSRCIAAEPWRTWAAAAPDL